MKQKARMPARQRGVAIVTALLLTTLAITIVASLFWQQQVQVRSIENQRLQLQKQWILRGALDWAALILRADAVTSNVDHLGEPWAVPLAETRLDQYVENGRADGDASDATLSGGITDAQARYNLNNLANNGNIMPGELAVLRNLFTILRINPSLAKAVADTVAAGQRKEAAPGAPPAARVPGSSTEPQPMRVEYVDDLLVVQGMTPQMVAKLKEYVVVLPEVTKININTAPVEVIAAKMATIATLTEADAATLVASRTNAHLRDGCELGTRLNKTNVPCDAFGLTTQYFFVNGNVRMNRAGLEVLALLKRENRAMPRVIWIREN